IGPGSGVLSSRRRRRRRSGRWRTGCGSNVGKRGHTRELRRRGGCSVEGSTRAPARAFGWVGWSVHGPGVPMASRYLGLSVLFLLAVLTPLLLDVRGGRDVPVEEELSGVPAEALEALRQGRFWRASRILRGYLAATPNPSP